MPLSGAVVRFAAAGHEGGVPGIFPPEKPWPWHPVHIVAMYAPYCGVGPSGTVAGDGNEWSIFSAASRTTPNTCSDVGRFDEEAAGILYHHVTFAVRAMARRAAARFEQVFAAIGWCRRAFKLDSSDLHFDVAVLLPVAQQRNRDGTCNAGQRKPEASESCDPDQTFHAATCCHG
jgi:hypothetical protein